MDIFPTQPHVWLISAEMDFSNSCNPKPLEMMIREYGWMNEVSPLSKQTNKQYYVCIFGQCLLNGTHTTWHPNLGKSLTSTTPPLPWHCCTWCSSLPLQASACKRPLKHVHVEETTFPKPHFHYLFHEILHPPENYVSFSQDILTTLCAVIY